MEILRRFALLLSSDVTDTMATGTMVTRMRRIKREFDVIDAVIIIIIIIINNIIHHRQKQILIIIRLLIIIING